MGVSVADGKMDILSVDKVGLLTLRISVGRRRDAVDFAETVSEQSVREYGAGEGAFGHMSTCLLLREESAEETDIRAVVDICAEDMQRGTS